MSESLPAPPKRRSLPPLPSRVSLPAWPKSRSSPDPPVSTSLPAPPNRCALGKCAVRLVEGERVVPTLTEDHDLARPAHVRHAAPDGHGPAVDEDVPGRVAADRDGVVPRIAEDG